MHYFLDREAVLAEREQLLKAKEDRFRRHQEAAKLKSKPAFEIYESPESVPIKETDELKPTALKELRMPNVNLKENDPNQQIKKRVTFSEEISQETKKSDSEVLETIGRTVLTAVDTREKKGLRF
jgi:hypothetical protein